MIKVECNRAAEGARWRSHIQEKAKYAREKVEAEERAKIKPCPLCEKKRLERIHCEEEEKRSWYNSLTRGQQIMAKIRGDYP